jgi:hypothetical protein
MMKIITSCFRSLIVVCALFLLPAPIHSQAWQWGVTGGGSGTDGGRKTCVDPSGNVFVAGYFGSSSINLNGNNMNNAGSSGTDVYVVKYDAAGNYLWSQRVGGTGSEFVGGICTDASGNVYLALYFDSPSISVSPYTVSNVGATDILVAKFNPTGSIMGLYKWGGANSDAVNGIAYASAQNAIYISGNYGSPTLAFGTTTLVNTNSGGFSYDLYLAKITTTGSVTWAKTTGGGNSNEYVADVAVDANSYPYVVGAFAPVGSGTTTIGTTLLTSYGGQDVYVAKWLDTGTFQWAKDIGTGSGQTDFATGLVIDGSNNLYISGYFYGNTMTVGSFTLANNGAYDVFVAKCNSAGTFQWANRFGSASSDYANDIAIDGSANIYVTGAFTGTTVAVGSLTLTNSNPGTTDEVFVVKYNSSGVAQWATSAQGGGYEDGYGISSDALGNVYVAGAYNNSSPIVLGTTTLSSSGGNDMFVAKIGCASAMISGLSTVCSGSSATLVASGATSYTWNTGATTTSVVITPTASGTYSVSGVSGSCTATPGSFSVTLLPASLYPGSNLNLTCNQSQVITATCSPAATSVTWVPATNLSSSSVLTPTATATGATTQYTVSAMLNNGCLLTKTMTVGSYAPQPDICMVTVDSLGINNEIFWDKALYPMLDSMIILRETSTNTFKRIGAVSANALSMFTDTARSVGPSNGDPTVSTYRYKIQMRDSCGVYSTPSLWHNTIYFTNSAGTFFWVNNYTIEGSPLPTNPVLNYSLMVCPNPSVSPNYSVIGVTAGNQNSLSDPNYLNYQLTADWRVYGNLGYSCIPSKPAGTNNVLVNAVKSRSNIQNNRLIGLKENNLSSAIKLYPNPVKESFTIENDLASEYSISVHNILGEVVYTSSTLKGKNTFSASEFAPGVYTVSVKQKDKTIAVKKIIVNK